jgi:sortase A
VTVRIILRGSSTSKHLGRSMDLRFAQRVFFIAGLLAVSYSAYTYAARYAYQTYQSFRLDRMLARPQPRQLTSSGPSAMALPIVRMAIPRLRIAAIVEEGIDNRTLNLAVGHIPYTALPGRPGNVGLAAHRDTLFRNLKDIRADDEITLTTLDREYAYRVAWFKVVNPSDVAVLEPTAGEETLTLVTCYPFYFVGDAPKRFIVRAHRIAR